MEDVLHRVWCVPSAELMHDFCPSMQLNMAKLLVRLLLGKNNHIHRHLFSNKKTISNDNDLAARPIDVQWGTS